MSRNAVGRGRGRDFLLGLAAGAVALAVGWPVYQWQVRHDAGSGPDGTIVEPAAWHAAQLRAAASAPAVQAASIVSAPAAQRCEFAPVLPVSNAQDGRFQLEPPLAARPTARHAAFVEVAKDAAQAGHYRDAEVALIVACRLAARASPAPTVPLADVQAVLGQFYGAAAAGQAPGDQRDTLLARARDLLARSAETYAHALGRHASKTRLARERLAGLPAAFDAAAPQPPQLPQLETAFVTGRQAPGEPQGPVQDGGQPAAAPAPLLVAADPQLAQLDRDLQRLRSQAASVSHDPTGLQQRAQAARARRDACSDKPCLLRWYAQRRNALLDEF
jgi:hypothetical protein